MKTGKMKLLITENENFSETSNLVLQTNFDVESCNLIDRNVLIEKASNKDIIFIRLAHKIDKDFIDKCPKLKYILTATTGLDHIDVDYFEKNGGKIISLKNEISFLETIPSTAEHTWALLLTLIKKIPSAFESVKNGEWNRNLYKGNNLRGKKIGILGLGRVGKQIAKFAEIFEMEIGYNDIENKITKFHKFNTADELFAWADIITIHIPLNADNDNFVNKKLLSKCKQNAILVNTSRGRIWDEIEIVKLLNENKLKGIATDVISNEFNKNQIAKNPLIEFAKNNSNVIVTPHIAGATYESMSMTEDFISNKFIDFLKQTE
jgi:D-3-phosphoglycerate dehydrogenase / 2-oxoglutarate reductase